MNKIRIALVGNGTYFNCSQTLKQYPVIIALDGGANHCRRMDITPHYIIGDNDSLPSTTKKFFRSLPYIYDSDQNTTDLQKGLALCKKIAHKKKYIVDLFCCTSETRLDHTQGAIQALQFQPSVHQIFSATQTIQVITARTTVKLTNQVDTIISLVPIIKTATVKLAGFQWSGNITLNHNSRSGISNIIKNNISSITVVSGKILVISNKRKRS